MAALVGSNGNELDEDHKAWGCGSVGNDDSDSDSTERMSVPRDGWGGVGPVEYTAMSRALLQWVCDEMETAEAMRWKRWSPPLRVKFRRCKTHFTYRSRGAFQGPRNTFPINPSL